MIHHETSVGLLNPVAAVGRLCRARGVTLVVDAVSSLGAEDLDVPPAPAAGTAVAGRIWCAAHKPVTLVARSLAGHPGGAQLAVTLRGPGGDVVASQAFGPGAAPLRAAAAVSGWHTLEVAARGFPAPVPYELDATYTAPPQLA